jgi:hypothetical protein
VGAVHRLDVNGVDLLSVRFERMIKLIASAKIDACERAAAVRSERD